MKSTGRPSQLYQISGRTEDPLSILLRGLAIFVLFFLVGLWTATEWSAMRLGFQPLLGKPLAPHIYAPYDGIVWAVRFHALHDPRVRAIFQEQWCIIGASTVFALLVAWLPSISAMRRVRKASDLHGSARWASEKDLVKAGLLGKGKGVYVGAWVAPSGKTRYLRHDGPEHVIAFAPTRSGKGVGLVVPTLLSWPHSVVVHDVKGENYALSAGWRANELGSRCIKFDPTAQLGLTARFNPFDEVRLRTNSEIQDVQAIVQMLVDPDGHGLEGFEAHWIASASAFLVGIILHVLYVGTDKSLGGVAELLSETNVESPTVLFRFIHDTVHDQGRTHPVVRAAMSDMLSRESEEAASVLSTAKRFLSLFRDPIVAANLATSDFSIDDLMNDEAPVSLYLVTPPGELTRMRPITRLLIHQILRRHTAQMEFEKGRNVANYRHRLLLMLDEFPALGRIEILQTSLAFMAGYGIKAYLICQDLAQLHAAYGGVSGREETIVANCHVQVAFAAMKLETMDMISRLSGMQTVRTESRSYSGSRLGLRTQVISTAQDTERALVTPDEVRRLPSEDSLIFVAGHPPIYGRKIVYYQDPVFSVRARIPAPTLANQVRVTHHGA